MATSSITRNDLLKKFDEFMADQSLIEKAKASIKMSVRPQFWIHVFVADFSSRSKIIGVESTDVYKRIAPFAKVLFVGDGVVPPMDKIEPGDLVTIPDSIVATQENPAYRQWAEKSGAKGTGALKTKQPTRWVSKLYSMLPENLYVFNKAETLIDPDYLKSLFQNPYEYKGPVVLKVEPRMIGEVIHPEYIRDQLIDGTN